MGFQQSHSHIYNNALSSFQHNKLKQEEEMSHYKKLHSMGVDVSKYVLSKNPRPDKIVRVIADDKAASLHLHRNWSLF